MSVSEELQRLSMIESLPHILSSEGGASIENVVHQAMPGAGPEFHMVASNTFRTILQQNLVPPATFTQTFLNSILASVDSRDPISAKAWLETLLDIIDLLPPSVVKNDILPVAVARGQLSQSVQSRVTSSELLGKIATKFENTQLQKEVLPLVHSLCQDVSGEVRASMCHQLPHIACGLSPEALKPSLIPLLVELTIDEEPSVRISAVHTIGSVISILPADVLKHTIVPLLMKVCEQALADENQVLCAISESYGQLCCGLKSALSESEKLWFLRFFRQLSKLGIHSEKSDNSHLYTTKERQHSALLVYCRQNCAYNFPAMTLFSGPVHFEEALYSTYASLSCDRVPYVRSSIAAGIHEVIKILGTRAYIILPELIVLMTDDVREVLRSLVPNLALILQHLSKNGCIGPSVMDSRASELMRAFLKCELVLNLSLDWRLHADMLAQMEHLPSALPFDLVYMELNNVLFHRVEDSRSLPCRLAAARTLLVLLKHTSKAEHREVLCNRICTELGSHYSCHTRLMFVKMCGLALDLFSSHFFKENFFMPLLSLAADPVPNVRLVLCGLLPRLKSLLKLPNDSLLLSTLQNAVIQLKNPGRPDKDVSAKLEKACLEMEKILLASHATNGMKDSEDLGCYEEERNLDLRSITPEPRRLVTVNMKTLGEGKKATLISLGSPEPEEQRLGLTNPRSYNNVGCNMGGSNTAVSSIGMFGGHSGGTSRITASISSSTCDSSGSFPSHNTNSKDPPASTITSWPRPLTYGSRLPLYTKSKTSRLYLTRDPQLLLDTKNVTTICMLLSQIQASASHTQSSQPSTNKCLISSGFPVLLEDEFYIDAGVPLPEKLTSTKSISRNSTCTDTARSKIPNLRELLFQNSTLLAQVANREPAADSDLPLKSFSYLKTLSTNKSDNVASHSGVVNKRYSRFFDENSSLAETKYQSFIGRSASCSTKKDTAVSSTNHKATYEQSFYQHSDDPCREIPQKPISSVSHVSLPAQLNSSVKDPKVFNINRHSFVSSSSQGSTSNCDRQKDSMHATKSRILAPSRNGKSDTSAPLNRRHTSMEILGATKLGNGIVSRLHSGSKSSVASPVQGSRPSSGKNISTTTIAMTKTTSTDVNRRHSSLEVSTGQDKGKDISKFGGGVPNKRFSLGEKNPGLVSAVDKKVSLSSIGVNGARRAFNSRPQSCMIVMRQNEKTSKINSRSLSQESLGIEPAKTGARIGKRTTMGMIRTENRMSRIPRGGTSCHSSPGNSRAASPTNSVGSSTLVTVSHTAPCSPGVSRPTSPTSRLQPRVSLASIKLHEPSRLPIRKYNHHM